jgi:hypothetical protein
VPDAPVAATDAVHDRPHADVAAEEWIFTCWTPDASLGAITGLRVHGATAWYWAALVRRGEPLLHVTEWDVRMRADPTVIKAHGLWAEHICEVPMQQWTVGNECFATAIQDPEEARGRAYGDPTAVAFDLEWYATAPPQPLGRATWSGYEQEGVVHGVVELPGSSLPLAEVPARRWHRWGSELGVLPIGEAYAHGRLLAPFAFPDGTVAEWALTADGWRSRPRT